MCFAATTNVHNICADEITDTTRHNAHFVAEEVAADLDALCAFRTHLPLRSLIWPLRCPFGRRVVRSTARLWIGETMRARWNGVKWASGEYLCLFQGPRVLRGHCHAARCADLFGAHNAPCGRDSRLMHLCLRHRRCKEVQTPYTEVPGVCRFGDVPPLVFSHSCTSLAIHSVVTPPLSSMGRVSWRAGL